MKFRAVVWRGNKMGAGFIRIPNNYYNNFKFGENLRVKILSKNNLSVFYPTISNYKNYLGVYIPKRICAANKLLGKEIKVKIEKLDGFHSRLTSDGRLYIPRVVAKKYNLRKNDLVIIKGNIGNKSLEKICKIHTRKKKNKKEYFCIFSRESRNLEGIFLIKEKLEKGNISDILKFILANVNYGIINEEKIVAFFTNKTPITIPYEIKMDNNLVYYLGCYFADGIKRGTSWGITASTFEQANFYLKMHKGLILNPNLHFYISITSRTSINKNELIKRWKDKCKINVENVKIKISDKHSKKVNRYGSLIIREYTRSTQMFYRRLLEYCIQKIIREKNKEFALDFICGVLEGDGSPSANSRGHIIISANKNDAKILEKILKISGLHFGIEKNSNKVSIRINSLSILKNIEILQNKIFKYYPKRRKKFIERFFRIGAVKYILGQQNYCSSWVKAWLKNEKFLNENYKLTPKGLGIKSTLVKMLKSVSRCQ